MANKAIVVLMAGAGERFRQANITVPKWAIRPPWTDRSLLHLSLAGIARSVGAADTLLVARARTFTPDVLAKAQGETGPATRVVELERLYPGPLASVAAAWGPLRLGSYQELWFTTCDTYMPAFSFAVATDCAGSVLCFDFDGPRLCHVDVDRSEQVVRLREKTGELARLSSTGAFRIACVAPFHDAMQRVMAKPSTRDSGEYFVSDAVNELIAAGHRFDAVVVPGSWPLGTVEDLDSCPVHIAKAMA